MRKCKSGKCALELIYPNGNNSTYACDSKCYLSYCDKETKQWYLKNYPEQLKVCGCINEKQL